MSILLRIIIVLALPITAGAQCIDEFYGRAGDTLYYGEEQGPFGTEPGKPYVWYISAIRKDSVAEDGTRRWWFTVEPDANGTIQYPSGRVAEISAGKVKQSMYGMCDTPGQIHYGRGMVFLGYDLIRLFGKPTVAMRYARYRFYPDTAVYTEYDFFVVPSFGEVLEYETHHGLEKRRLVGAVVNGVRYGAALTTNVAEDRGPIAPIWVDGGVVRAGGTIAPGSHLEVYDVHGRCVQRAVLDPHGSVALETLPSGLYLAVILDARSSQRSIPVRVVVR